MCLMPSIFPKRIQVISHKIHFSNLDLFLNALQRMHVIDKQYNTIHIVLCIVIN